MDDTNKTESQHPDAQHTCNCHGMWMHKRPLRLILAIVVLVFVFSAGLVMGKMHGGYNNFGRGRGHMMRGNFPSNVMYRTNGNGNWRQAVPAQGTKTQPQQFVPGTQVRGMMRTINYGTDMPATIGQPDEKL